MNLSSGGILFETATRVLPGSRVEVVVPSATGSQVAGGQVVRAWVAHIPADGVVRYRAAVRFDREVVWELEVSDE